MHTYRGCSSAQSQGVHIVHSVHCSHSFEEYCSEHTQQNVPPPSSGDKSSKLKPSRRLSAFFSPLSAVLCKVYFFSVRFLLSFVARVLFLTLSLFFLFFSSLQRFSSSVAFFSAVSVTIVDFLLFLPSFLHFVAEVTGVQPPDRSQCNVPQYIGLFL